MNSKRHVSTNDDFDQYDDFGLDDDFAEEDDLYAKLPSTFIKRIEFWDLARNGYIFTQYSEQDFHFDYCPMTSRRSSSKHYNGGPSIQKKISAERFAEAENQFKIMQSKPHHSGLGPMGSLLFCVDSSSEKEQFHMEGLHSQEGKHMAGVFKAWKQWK
mmetsp:Transcript_1339/g.1786  ORF Transcript_1339/g.1786 Transcript_1339/m.1786 type:complete len:158 (-) Transcript_1339:37-510(-)